ncbi:TetR/AcrR family transcriptional regulator [Spiractinospora alimapuensis]|uniref:TetR/AcrR family transcriptional regulator n=1 Tax=Spiractinospora alimapuensis TaxID=2820884 RepID=UPI001F2A04D6|nr:TetR/AcrR family transcriptional regulator [Spiractinospora alimapuensis]QVQ50163.1 TetR/AcrR family transcriptional regulator [Spiractinospora alimapuensis]
MTAIRTARERAREELTREIADAGRRHLAEHGAPGLSLRAIARELGMVSSAIHRYFPTKDDLLTRLIVDGYNAVGDAIERADADVPRDAYTDRWLASCHALRDWARDNPHEYALIYGSPVPGYAAPSDTVLPAARGAAVVGAVLRAAHEADALRPPPGYPAPPPEFAEDAERLRPALGPLPDETIARAVTAWTAVFGWLSFALFGQFANGVEHQDAAFDHHLRTLAAYLGLPPTGPTPPG